MDAGTGTSWLLFACSEEMGLSGSVFFGSEGLGVGVGVGGATVAPFRAIPVGDCPVGTGDSEVAVAVTAVRPFPGCRTRGGS